MTRLGAGLLRAVMVLTLGACSPEPALAPSMTTPAAQPTGLVVHEWGTFTSLVGTDGRALEGMHHEDEALPAFVHGRAPQNNHMKSMEGVVSGVTQKLETPVLYFHGMDRGRVQVDVGFPRGVISQWYPQAKEYLPAVGTAQTISGGWMRWDVELDAQLNAFPAVAPEDIWAPSRNVDATALRAGGDQERFIFYRGLGAFDVPLVAYADPDGTISITNDSDQPVSAVFLLTVHDDGAAIVNLGGLRPRSAHTGIDLPQGGKERDLDAYVAAAASSVAQALEQTGLYPDEARAMVDTWSRSYFRTPGVRILYMVPRAWTDALLPITVTPVPSEMVRTLVGRVELLTPAEETRVVVEINAAASAGGNVTQLVGRLGRFAEPKLRRALSLIRDTQARQLVNNALFQLALLQ